jgi:hypothetical protein
LKIALTCRVDPRIAALAADETIRKLKSVRREKMIDFGRNAAIFAGIRRDEVRSAYRLE